MSNALFDSYLDMTAVGILLIGLLTFSYFRLDTMFASSKRARAKTGNLTGTGVDGTPIFSDPDGRPWKRTAVRK